MSIEINGKVMSAEEAQAAIAPDNVKVQSISVQFPRKAPDDGPMTNEAFTVEADFLASCSEYMDDIKAGFMKMGFKNSKKLLGKDFYIIMVAPNYTGWWKRQILKVAFWALR